MEGCSLADVRLQKKSQNTCGIAAAGEDLFFLEDAAKSFCNSSSKALASADEIP